MTLPRDALLLRIFFGEDDKFNNRPLYEAIVMTARENHLAGATVLRGPMGFGQSSRLHTAKILRLSEDLPMIIEIVDSEDKIKAFLPDAERDDAERPHHLAKRAGAAIRHGREARAGVSGRETNEPPATTGSRHCERSEAIQRWGRMPRYQA